MTVGQRLDKLTSLRFFAALMVVFFHCRLHLTPSVVALCVVASMIFYRFIESRLTRGLKAHFMGRWAPRTPSPLLSG